MADWITSFSETNLWMNLWCLLIFSLGILSMYKVQTSDKYTLEETPWKKFFLVFWVFTMTSFCNPDYFHYMEFVEGANVGLDNITNSYSYEKYYQYLCSVTNGNYLLFRMGVWLPALCCFAYTVHRHGIPLSTALFTLFAMYSVLFSYGRVALAIAVYFFGASFIIKPISNRRFISYLIGLMLIASVPLFHRSSYILIALTPILFIIKSKSTSSIRWLFIYSIVLFGLVAYFSSLLYVVDVEDEFIAAKLSNYSEREFEKANIFGIITKVLKFSTLYLPAILITYSVIIKKHYQNWNSSIETDNSSIDSSIAYLYLTLAVILVSLGLYVSNPETNYTLYYRTLNMCIIPSSIAISGLYTQNIISSKLYKTIINIGLLWGYYNLVNCIRVTL